MRTSSILKALAFAIAIPATLHAAPDTDATSKKTLIEFITVKDLAAKSKDLSLTPNNYYYSNGMDDPKQQPAVGEDGGVKFIQIKGAGDENTMELGKAAFTLVRDIKIPANAPKEILVTCSTKSEDKPLSGWESGSQAGDSALTANLRFAKAGLQGKLTQLPLEPNKGWKNHELKLTVPQGAEYLILQMRCGKNQSVALGNWTIH